MWRVTLGCTSCALHLVDVGNCFTAPPGADIDQEMAMMAAFSRYIDGFHEREHTAVDCATCGDTQIIECVLCGSGVCEPRPCPVCAVPNPRKQPPMSTEDKVEHWRPRERNLSHRCTYLYGLAASLGATAEQLAGRAAGGAE